MVTPINSNSPNYPSDISSKPHVVADHVANKLHAERQAYLNSANDGANSPSLLRLAITAIGRPLLTALRSARTVANYTVARVRGGRSEKVVPVTSAPHSPTQSAVRSAIQSAIQSPIQSPIQSASDSPWVYPGSDSGSPLSSLTMSPTPRDGTATPDQSPGRPPLHSTAGSYMRFESALGPRAPGEEKSGSPPDSPLGSARIRPNLALEESALRSPTNLSDVSSVQAAVRFMAMGLHQSRWSPTGSSSSPFPLLEGYVSPSSSEGSRFESSSDGSGDEAWIYSDPRVPFFGDFNTPRGSLNGSPVWSEYQSSVGTPPREQARLQVAVQARQQSSPPDTPPPGLPSLAQPSQHHVPQPWWESSDLVQEPEDMDVGCYCGLGLLVPRLVWGDPPLAIPPVAHPAE